jgi:hypothetical protein
MPDYCHRIWRIFTQAMHFSICSELCLIVAYFVDSRFAVQTPDNRACIAGCGIAQVNLGCRFFQAEKLTVKTNVLLGVSLRNRELATSTAAHHLTASTACLS